LCPIRRTAVREDLKMTGISFDWAFAAALASHLLTTSYQNIELVSPVGTFAEKPVGSATDQIVAWISCLSMILVADASWGNEPG
jgi:hypothetical protein